MFLSLSESPGILAASRILAQLETERLDLEFKLTHTKHQLDLNRKEVAHHERIFHGRSSF